MKRNCKLCGSIFEAVNNAQKFCSVECREDFSQGRRKESKMLYKQRQRLKITESTKQEKTAGEIDKEAKENGTSYGKHVAATEYQVKIVRKW